MNISPTYHIKNGNFFQDRIRVSWYGKAPHTDRVSSISLKYSSVRFAIPFTPIMAEGGGGGGGGLKLEII